MANKISNKFKPDSCTYRLGKDNYLSKPTNTTIKYYLQENGHYVAVLRRNVYVLSILAITSLLVLIYIKLFYPTNNLIVKYSETLYYKDNVLSVDLQNDSDVLVTYVIKMKDVEVLKGNISPKESVSNIDCIIDGPKGNYSGELIVSIKDITVSKDILIVVN